MVLLLSLLAIPVLMVLSLVLEWLEQEFAKREVADEIARLLAAEEEIEILELRIARAAERLVTRLDR